MLSRERQRVKRIKILGLTSMLAAVGALLCVALLSHAGRASQPSSNAFAAIDFAPVPGASESNRERLTRLIIEASQRGAKYVVLPELSLIAPPNDADAQASHSQPRIRAEQIPGPTTEYFAQYARKLGIWLVISLPEKADEDGGYFLTAVLLNEQGEVVNKYRKSLVRQDGEDGSAKRGNYRDILDTIDAGGLRLGIMSGDDILVGVPRLANRGADTILIPAGWKASDPVQWLSLCRQLSQQYAVNLVVANRWSRTGLNVARTEINGGIYTKDGQVFLPDSKSEAGLILAALPATSKTWRIESALGLPSVPVPSHEPASPEIAELGRQLFFDKHLSSTGTVSCSSCHQPEKAFTNGEAKGIGVYGRKTTRNVPSLLNVAFRPLLRWDGYASTLENFAKYPMSGVTEMDFHYLDKVVDYVRSQPEYVKAFRSTMGVEEIQFDDVARALSTYTRTLVSGNSPFDRYYYGGEKSALSQSAQRGLKLFTGKAGCATCHLIGERYALFMDFKYHALGFGYDRAQERYTDVGLGGISTDELQGFFQTPSLRNVAETAPYMHDGSMKTLAEVIEFYNHGGGTGPHRDPLLKSLFLKEQEKADLLAFLQSLTGNQHYSAQGERLKNISR